MLPNIRKNKALNNILIHNKGENMKQTSKKLITVIILIFGLFSLQAQETVSATGGEATGSGGSASYSIGQVVYTTHTGTNGNYSAQGVQQPFEISVVTVIPEAENISISISIYPNPASDFLTLTIIGDIVKTQFIASLYDINGKLQKSKNITADKTKITINNLTPGTYFLKVTDNKKVIKSFKIIKN